MTVLTRIPLLLISLGLCQHAYAAETSTKAELRQAIFPYESTYFAFDPGWLTTRPQNAKFQFSFAIHVVHTPSREPDGPLRPDGLFVAYSQTSFWDLESDSKPFFDSSYRPEAWWHVGVPSGGFADHAGIEPGIGHESNGKSGAESRSINHVFLRGLAEWEVQQWSVQASPRVRAYTDKEDNPDIQRYRGYVDLQLSAARPESWGVTLTGRIGSRVDRASILAEVTHPTASWTKGWIEGYLYLQAFSGWSETLLAYNQRTESPRILLGYSITR
jgi:outer membrane phospholipase A